MDDIAAQSSPKHIDTFPRPLLDDLIQGRWLPIVGAGMSRNAIVAVGKEMPLWDGFGRALAQEIPAYPYTGAMDAISGYAHEYSRVKLVERTSDLLMIDSARPGAVHSAFCSIPFDVVCTTNFDFLLERQYESSQRYCRPVIDEDQLSIGHRDTGTMLLKLHGDIHHPQRLVITEEDYDRFLERYPLLATYLANLLINRTAVLIGYSLDDPDFRQIWQVIGERLGRLRRPAYSIMVDAKPTDVARFERRGVKVVNLSGQRSNYGQTLTDALGELHQYLSANLISASQATQEESMQELALPKDTGTRLCFFAIPTRLQSLYREFVFPLVDEVGLVPMTATDIISPSDNISAKIDALMERSAIVVVDISTSNTVSEFGIALSKLPRENILVIAEEGEPLPADIGAGVVFRTVESFEDGQSFIDAIRKWLATAEKRIRPRLANEPARLLTLGEFRAAIIAAFSLLEVALRDRLGEQVKPTLSGTKLLRAAEDAGILTEEDYASLRHEHHIRSRLLHLRDDVSEQEARAIVEHVLRVVGQVQAPP